MRIVCYGFWEYSQNCWCFTLDIDKSCIICEISIAAHRNESVQGDINQNRVYIRWAIELAKQSDKCAA